MRDDPEVGDFDALAELSGDANPIQVDGKFAAKTRFGLTVAFGAYEPANGEALTGSVEITRLRPE